MRDTSAADRPAGRRWTTAFFAFQGRTARCCANICRAPGAIRVPGARLRAAGVRAHTHARLLTARAWFPSLSPLLGLHFWPGAIVMEVAIKSCQARETSRWPSERRCMCGARAASWRRPRARVPAIPLLCPLVGARLYRSGLRCAAIRNCREQWP